MNNYLCQPISNGNPREQAMIRRWWHETYGARGRLVWEYCLEGLYADALWFPDAGCFGIEESGQQTSIRFPLRGSQVILCEAKLNLTPALIGQALVYSWYAKRAGACVRETVLFAASDPKSRRAAAEALGLTVVLHPGDSRRIRRWTGARAVSSLTCGLLSRLLQISAPGQLGRIAGYFHRVTSQAV